MITGLIIGMIIGGSIAVIIMACLTAGGRADDVLAQMEMTPYWEIDYARPSEDELGRILDNLNEKYGSPTGLKRALEKDIAISEMDDERNQ